MRPITAAVIAAIVAAAGLAVSGQAWAQAQITRDIENVREATVFAHWEYPNSFGGTTFVDVIATQPSPGSTSSPFADFSIIGTDANGFVVSGFIDLVNSTLTLTEATDLSTARLQASGTALNLIDNNGYPFSLDLTFNATGALVDDRSNFHIVEPGTVINSRFDGQNRDATSTGTLQIISTNYTPVPSQTGQIQFNREGSFFQQIVLPPPAQ